MTVMFEKGVVTRVDIGSVGKRAAPWKTLRGIGIGSTEAQLRRAYGARLKRGVGYDEGPDDRLYYYWSSSGNGIKVQLVKGRVLVMTAGSKSIQYYENCL